MKTRELAERAKEELVELTGLSVETVSSVRKENDAWLVRVDLVELRMTPNTRDVLGVYEVELNSRGELQSYRRIGRYQRQQLTIEYE